MSAEFENCSKAL